jgi:tripartite-type tricarboxylate transporter receptor subunit TctC
VTSKKRSSLAPEIPTMTELGLPALNFGAWWGMWGPPALPADLTRVINDWVNAAVKDLAAEGKLAAFGIEAHTEMPQFFAKFMAEDFERSSKLLKAANFQPE